MQASLGSLERAGDWLFNHMDGSMDAAVAEVMAQQRAQAAGGGGAAGGAAAGGAGAGEEPLSDGPGKYKLLVRGGPAHPPNPVYSPPRSVDVCAPGVCRLTGYLFANRAS